MKEWNSLPDYVTQQKSMVSFKIKRITRVQISIPLGTVWGGGGRLSGPIDCGDKPPFALVGGQ